MKDDAVAAENAGDAIGTIHTEAETVEVRVIEEGVMTGKHKNLELGNIHAISTYIFVYQPISLDQIANCEQDVAALMGFAGFDTTKNKKVSGNYEGAVKINKPRRYRQYMNRKVLTMTNCLGSVISVDCGEFGYYQGRLISLDAESKDIVLGSAFKEGVPLGKNVTLNGAQIISLKVLKAAQPAVEPQVASTSSQSDKKDGIRKTNGVKQNGSIVHRSKSTIEFLTMTNCLGSVISVDCGEFGYYQGRLISLDAESKDIVLGSAFKEGVPLGKNVTLNGAQIISLKVLKAAQPAVEPQIASTSNQPDKKDSIRKTNGVKQNGSIVHRSKSTIEFSNEDNSNHRHKINWQSRPLAPVQNKSNHNATHRKASSVSSTSEEGQSGFAADSSKDRTRTRKVRRSESEHCFDNVMFPQIQSPTVCLSETPHFRRFEPQVPLPREVLAAKIKSRGKPKGPSGNPLLDSRKLRGRLANGNDELIKPIDFDLLDTDFDFAANLEQFKREDLEDDYYESVEKKKMSQNFAHYENIIDDPTRCTSWTNIVAANNASAGSGPVSTGNKSPPERHSPPMRSISFCPSGYETTYDGFPLPVLDVALKKKYLQECCTVMGQDAYFYLVADRLIMWLVDVVGRTGLSLDNAVVLASSVCTVRLLDRVLCHLDNRGCSTTVYGKYPSIKLSTVTVVDRVPDLPTTSKIVIVLAEELTAETQSWLGKQKTAHVVSLECAPAVTDPQKLHILMLGVLTSGLYTFTSNAQPQIGKTSFAQLCAAIKSCKFIDSAVCDVGAPYSWIAEDGKANLQQTFSTTLMRRLC
ncbi:hypothetical protein OESDEN_05989 [Oesophagostomum dentatum]|uniref:Uncharacterized protein n=1 Tax=Oesophagostomum dentatum TaxID=61180 RepID=A0A0B1TDA2_OESDE|nr:hypothetical protein OESDEN_05989 [Oesophagostomum dentatum]